MTPSAPPATPHTERTLLALAAELWRPESRTVAAGALAAALGARALLIFIRDKEIGVLLPAPGFQQTLPDGRAWRAFLDECVTSGHAVATLRLRAADEPLCADGLAWEGDAVVVLLGSTPCARDMPVLRSLLPLLAATFRGERITAQAELHARLSREAAARTAVLVGVLEGARAQLEAALQEAREARNALEMQAIELEAQADELRTSNLALISARRAADLANRAKSDFLTTMSHELRTPLNAIGGHAQLLEMGLHGPVTAEQRGSIERIIRGQRHLLGLINDILNLSRIEAGQVEYRIVEVPLAEAIDDVRSMLEPQLAEKSLAFDVHDADQLPVLRTDRDKLQQILLNLLFNAVKFTEPGGRIWVEVRAGEQDVDTVVIRVSDTGIGIPMDKLAMIFEPFTQVRAGLTRPQEGTGLGLAISRDLARGLGGDLTAESTVGAGSSFVLRVAR